uniref:Uncharacterized protein n=1 Tax=Melanopsichium pennsylvanicum 4 TaxID=1398559 RepID=A0A077R3C5_9BASI|nr:uncharacterized protein BN887_02901 [Melanopsichium pennsylvanicum 4]
MCVISNETRPQTKAQQGFYLSMHPMSRFGQSRRPSPAPVKWCLARNWAWLRADFIPAGILSAGGRSIALALALSADEIERRHMMPANLGWLDRAERKRMRKNDMAMLYFQ